LSCPTAAPTSRRRRCRRRGGHGATDRPAAAAAPSRAPVADLGRRDALLRDNATRAFRVDVETDSTIEPNEQAEKAQTVELLEAVSNMVTSWGPALERAPMLAPMVAAFIKFGVRRFRAGRELETIIDQAMDQIGAGGMQPPQAPGQGAPAQPPPDQTPLLVAQTNLQREQVHQSGEIQRAQIQAQVQAGDQQLHAGDQRLKMLIGGRDQTPQVAV
jgi:hypothetical protein